MSQNTEPDQPEELAIEDASRPCVINSVVETYTISDGLLGRLYRIIGHARLDLVYAPMVTELAASLCGYREEEVPLYPLVFICSAVDSLAGPVPRTIVGSGMSDDIQLAARILKQCAPLAVGGWAIFVEVCDRQCRYGIFRPPTESLSADPEFVLGVAPGGGENVIYIRALTRDAVEIGLKDHPRIHIHLSGRAPRNVDIFTSVEQLAQWAVSSLSIDRFRKVDIERFLRLAVLEGVRRGHGCLIAVARSKDPFKTAVWLDPPVNIADAVSAATEPAGFRRLLGVEYLIHGVLASDGVTVFSNDGHLLGLRAMVDLPANTHGINGGGRSHAYQYLKSLVGKSLVAAMKVSQDGGVDIHTGSEPVLETFSDETVHSAVTSTEETNE